ncbi:DUF3422 family protein [Novosphingobium sp. Fuku2-ISO-50]|uniref:DUF3422 family protein n=1 Tax=Novosphingobium sp. Fuku2-ISO-50 TaxID=1739114 RepID=UPI00076C1E7C|nr:DUF3422 domain-containing protein [Novosphingobium sp. Fuku2-ISO-50]KUR78335.1 hypothetical protein AQZ50_07300 [Novosphingobium sp. Fuku2-ISO-50]
MGFREHPLRRQVVGEMHLRRWPALRAPMVVIQVLRLVDEPTRLAERAVLGNGVATLEPSDNPRHCQGVIAGVPFVWEAHSEASGLTLFVDSLAIGPDFDRHPALDWAAAFPGETLRATRIAIVGSEAEAEAMLPTIGFVDSDMVSCHLGDQAIGRVRIWSDFRIGAGGFGHLLIAAPDLAPGDLSRLVQRLQELGNYRNLALMGLPVAQAAWGELGGIEQALSELANEVARPDVTDDMLLDHVSALSLDLMALSTRGGFRMSATQAYARLVEERLDDCAPRAIAGYPSLTDFTQRRLLPAVRTCSAHVRRVDELSQRADRFAALLRTRIETRIENQNARLLESMERSSSLQLRLQQLVEGLSVVALSYYGIGLIGTMLKAAEHANPRIDAALWIGGLVPVVTGGMWWGLHRMKHRLLGRH